MADDARSVSTPPPGRRSAARAESDETRRALLSAAHDLLATEGPTALSVRRIAAAAGVSTMNVYSRFGGKDGVMNELFIDGFVRLGEMTDNDGADELDDTMEALRRCGASYRRFAAENPTYYSLMFDRAIPDWQPSAEAHAAAIAALDRVVRRVARAMQAGTVHQGDPFVVAAALWATGHGVVSLTMREFDKDMFDWGAIAEAQSEAILRGFAAE